ncbi:MAG: hypothetical protein HY842_15195 [Bacteroidetes bacterium]|nr:hypothetical protein [Bacteroidota bacterium]
MKLLALIILEVEYLKYLVHLRRFMIYAGYQGTKIGSENLPNWAMGTGMWF